MVKRHYLAVLVFLIIAGFASTAPIVYGSTTAPYSSDFDLRDMTGFSDNIISAENIIAFIQDKYPSSPMLNEADIGNCFISAGQSNSVNPAFLVATACLEGGCGTAGWAASHPECHNTFGYGIPSGTTPPDDINCMDSWCVMVQRVASVIAHGHNYYTQGLYTVSQVRTKYAASPNADSIASLMNELYTFSLNHKVTNPNTVITGASAGANQSSVSDILVFPSQVLSPVVGSLEVVSTLGDCSNTKWCFNQYKTEGHVVNGGICQADDTYAWDVNLNTPTQDSDKGQPVYAVAPGTVCQTYGECKNANDGGTYGQVLIEHSYQGSKWWSGYLHMTNIQVTKGQAVTESTIIGYISNIGVADKNNHLHFAVYTGNNRKGKLKSFNTQISPRIVPAIAENNTQGSSTTSSQPVSQTNTVTITLYVTEIIDVVDGTAVLSGIPSAKVTGSVWVRSDNRSTTGTADGNGCVILTAIPGNWSFTIFAPGYETVTFGTQVTDNCTLHEHMFKLTNRFGNSFLDTRFPATQTNSTASFQPDLDTRFPATQTTPTASSQPDLDTRFPATQTTPTASSQPVSQNSVVGKWRVHVQWTKPDDFGKKVPDVEFTISFNNDGTFEVPESSKEPRLDLSVARRVYQENIQDYQNYIQNCISAGNWLQSGNTISWNLDLGYIYYDPMYSDNSVLFGELIYEGTMNGDSMSGTVRDPDGRGDGYMEGAWSADRVDTSGA